MSIFRKKKKIVKCNHVFVGNKCVLCNMKKPVIKESIEPEVREKKEHDNVDISGKKRIPKKDLKDEEFYYAVDVFKPKQHLSKRVLRKERKLRKKFPSQLVLVRFELGSGMFREFYVPENIEGFVFNKKRYVFDTNQRYFVVERGCFAYDFHEHLSLPLRKRFNITPDVETLLTKEIESKTKKPLRPFSNISEIQTLIENSKVVDVEESINPMTLKRFTDSEVIKQVLAGAMLSKILKIAVIVLFVVLLLSFFSFALNLWSSGLIEKVTEMFK